MPIYKLRNLGRYGVITDIPAYDLPPEGWTMANNIRFSANRLEKMGGYFPIPNLSLGNNETPLMFLQEPNSSAILLGSNTDLYRFDGSSNPVSIKNPNHTYSADVSSPWDYSLISSNVVFNNGKDIPQAWIRYNRPLNQDYVIDLPGWGKNTSTQTNVAPWSCSKMRSFKNYLIALNMVEDEDGKGGTVLKNFPQRVRWSDISYVGSLPSNWTSDGSSFPLPDGTSANSDGGFNDLADCQGIILDGRPMRDSFMIYTTHETYVMDYIGGQNIFSFRKLYPDSGLLNPNCVCEFEGSRHFVISEDDIYIHDGSTKQSVATDIIKEYLFSQITSSNYQATKVFPYPSKKEIWITYPTGQKSVSASGLEGEYACDKAAVWNWVTNQWSFTDLPDTLWLDEILSPSVGTRTWGNIDSSVPTKPTEILLDSPIYSLPVGKSFRINLLYKPGEELGSNQKIRWESSATNIFDITASDLDLDYSLNLRALSEGEAVLKATIVDVVTDTSTSPPTITEVPSTDAKLTASYKIKVTPEKRLDPLYLDSSGKPIDPANPVYIDNNIGLRHMESDDSDLVRFIQDVVGNVNPSWDTTIVNGIAVPVGDGKLDRYQDSNEPIPDRTSQTAIDNGAVNNTNIGAYRPEQKDLYPDPTKIDPDDQWSGGTDPVTGNEIPNKHSTDTWEQGGYSFTRKSFVGCSADHGFYFLDSGTVHSRVTGNSSPVIAYATKYGISMSEIEDCLGRHKTWRTIWPLMSGRGKVSFITGGSEDPYTPPSFNNSMEFNIGVDYKIDSFVNNKFLALTIKDENEGTWSISGIDIDFFVGGLR